MTREHLIAGALFTYPEAPQAALTCAACNGGLSACERELFNDPFVQQAKSALHPVNIRDRKRRGWIINEAIAHHGRKPGHQALYGPDKEVVRVFAPEPGEAVWRSVGKTILIFAAFVVGDRAFDPALDELRAFVRQGGSASAAGLRRGPNAKVDRWDDYHELRADRIDAGRFGISVALFARYSFAFTCKLPAPMPARNARIFRKLPKDDPVYREALIFPLKRARKAEAPPSAESPSSEKHPHPRSTSSKKGRARSQKIPSLAPVPEVPGTA
jgi:hypothetical protein